MTDAPARRPRGRSPAYPAISLPAAIQRAEEVWTREHQHQVAVETLPRIWGYKALNGPASTTLSALIKFGLATDEGSGEARRARISDLAVEIIANPSMDAREAAVKRAALLPPIHKELWEKFGAELPSDANLLWELTRERGFTETGAKEFIREYRDTLDFARLHDGQNDIGTESKPSAATAEDLVGSHSNQPPGFRPDILDGMFPVQHKPQPQHQPVTRSAAYKIPLTDGSTVDVAGPFPLPERDWSQFMAVLQAMKPGLVRELSDSD